ncbi:mobile mystery protein A [Brevundimonas aurantiaca]|jgi:predicted DNA-binding mobile mystery protein A|uniref:mobile mystery protein A n=1 Tax=Brevundimonas aurantiaca TaxID=74316 RepID=UPI001D17E7F5|nr:mobile mystery protein A [Brevundimonas aurantiaca]MCC4293842.1 mobile mystery protein A [Brevundimonas aurantiaca]
MGYQHEREALARKHLDKQLSEIRLGAFSKPPKGWLRAVRDALGLTTRQLAERMNKAQPSITALEKNEATESITLKSLREAAEALDCQLVYAIVPKDSLDATVRKQARKAAEARLRRINHTMSLEAQGVRKPELEAELDRLTDEILRAGGSRLWEDA